ncbi:MAG: class I SAM-dependent RNA methyltransferase [Gemmatimonadales bacterium]|nr:MAG: class I SAM-dependent RNA methyltransferase [Gemmatimonadales bacterium]
MTPVHEVEIDGIGSDGAGVGRLDDGRVVFVHRTAPGDRARIRLVTEKRRWARGKLEAVLEPGPGRREPPCRHYERCGGCTLEHLEIGAQLEARTRRVLDALERIGGLDPEALPEPELHPSPREFGYRNRATFTLVRTRTGVIAGFHRLEAPGRIEDVDGDCRVLEPALARLWDGIRASWGPEAGRLPGGRSLRLVLRALSDGTGLLLVEPGPLRGAPVGPSEPATRGAADLLAEVEGLRAVWWRPGPDAPPLLLAGQGGDDEPAPEEVWFGERIPVRPGQFLQVNRAAAEHLHELALREIGPPRTSGDAPGSLVDAYCGHGVYGRRFAGLGGRATGIELDPRAVASARERPVAGFRILEGRVEDRLPEAVEGADRVLLNPPRGGTGSRVMQILAGPASASLRRMVYVSCDPATLARDLATLGVDLPLGTDPGEGPRRSLPRTVSGGSPALWQLQRLQLFDLFPQTAHVETMVTLVRPVRTT